MRILGEGRGAQRAFNWCVCVWVASSSVQLALLDF